MAAYTQKQSRKQVRELLEEKYHVTIQLEVADQAIIFSKTDSEFHLYDWNCKKIEMTKNF